MSEAFLTKEDDARLEFLLRLHQNGKSPLVSDDSIDGVAQHIHHVLFPSGMMGYITTRRVVNFPDALIERLQKAGIWLKFSTGFAPIGEANIDITYSDANGTTVSYRVPLVFKFQ